MFCTYVNNVGGCRDWRPSFVFNTNNNLNNMRYFVQTVHLIIETAEIIWIIIRKERVFNMNKEDFSKQVLTAESSLYRVAKSILHNDEDCADAIQNGILKAYQKLDTLRNEAYFKTWLTRIVINECYSLVRAAQKYVPFDQYPGWDAEAVYDATEESDLMIALVQLDEKYRIPLVLHEIEGYSVKEIGKILGLSETNVGNRIFRGKKKLREQLEGVK